jgi:RimJ/RimL family protein N-acetyltransferase
LIAESGKLARAELQNRARFARLLAARVPENWPPPLDTADSIALRLERLEQAPEPAGWRTWYLVLREHAIGGRVLIGSAEFLGRPTADGTVEIGYSVLQEFQGVGYATEAVKGLLVWAFGHREVTRVIAETLPELTPSRRVLQKSGFTNVGKGSADGVIRFERSRSAHEGKTAEARAYDGGFAAGL